MRREGRRPAAVQTRSTTCIPVGVDRLFPTRSTTCIHAGEGAQGIAQTHLASKSMTYVINFGGASVGRTETLIESELP